MTDPASLSTRVTDLLGVRYPIVQAPMGWIARAQLASAVSNAGAMGIIEVSFPRGRTRAPADVEPGSALQEA